MQPNDPLQTPQQPLAQPMPAQSPAPIPQPQPSAPQEALPPNRPQTLQIRGTLYNGILSTANTAKIGLLSLSGNALAFIEDQTQVSVFSVTPATTKSISVQPTGFRVKTADKHYVIMIEGSEEVFSQLGNMTRPFTAFSDYKRAEQTEDRLGLSQWTRALSAAGFITKDEGLGSIKKWGIIALIVFVIGVFIYSAISVLNSRG